MSCPTFADHIFLFYFYFLANSWTTMHWGSWPMLEEEEEHVTSGGCGGVGRGEGWGGECGWICGTWNNWVRNNTRSKLKQVIITKSGSHYLNFNWIDCFPEECHFSRLQWHARRKHKAILDDTYGGMMRHVRWVNHLLVQTHQSCQASLPIGWADPAHVPRLHG